MLVSDFRFYNIILPRYRYIYPIFSNLFVLHLRFQIVMTSFFYLSIIIAGIYQMSFPGTEIDSILGFIAMIGIILSRTMDDANTNR